MEYIIETNRLKLRKINDDDFFNLKDIISDKQTMLFYPKPYDDEGVHKWVKWCLDCYDEYGFGLWAIELKDNNRFIGDCGISKQDVDGQHVFEIGYHLNKKYWHQGYAIEAARAVKQYFFDNYDYDEIYSYMASNNESSIRLAIANGMSFIKNFDLNGISHDVYRITRKEYELQRIYYVIEKKNDYFLLKHATFSFTDKEVLYDATNTIKSRNEDLIVGKYVRFLDETLDYRNDSLYIYGKSILLDNDIEEIDRNKYEEQFNRSIKAYLNKDESSIMVWDNYLKEYENKFFNFKKIN